MAIMDLFTSLQTIVNERSAKKVRQSIHDGIFRANQVADANKNLVDQVSIRQDAVEQFNEQMIVEMTDKEFASGPEIVQMRDGEANANARLERDANNFRKLLSQNLKKDSNNFSGVVANVSDGVSLQGKAKVFVEEWGANDATSIRQVGSSPSRVSAEKAYFPIDDVDLEIGKLYTITIYVRNDRLTNTSPTVKLEGFDGVEEVTVPLMDRLIFKGVCNGDYPRFVFKAPNPTVNLYFTLWRLQILEGDHDKDWQPANSDAILATELLSSRLGPASNSDGAITKLINIGLTYASSLELAYGNDYVPVNENVVKNSSGKWELDCSSFIHMILQGVTYDNSKYFQPSNVTGHWRYPQLPSVNEYGNRLLAHQIAQWCFDNGLTFDIDISSSNPYSNLQPGDIIFQYNSPETHFWRKVGHIGVFLGKNPNRSYNQILQCGGGDPVAAMNNNPVDIHTLTNAYLLNRKTYLAARLPLSNIEGQVRNITVDNQTKSLSIPLTEDLEKFKVYTVFIKVKSSHADAYPMLRIGDGETSVSNVWSARTPSDRPDKIYKAVLYFNDSTWKDDADIRRLQILTANSNGVTTVLEWAKVYRGYVTEWD